MKSRKQSIFDLVLTGIVFAACLAVLFAPVGAVAELIIAGLAVGAAVFHMGYGVKHYLNEGLSALAALGAAVIDFAADITEFAAKGLAATVAQFVAVAVVGAMFLQKLGQFIWHKLKGRHVQAAQPEEKPAPVPEPGPVHNSETDTFRDLGARSHRDPREIAASSLASPEPNPNPSGSDSEGDESQAESDKSLRTIADIDGDKDDTDADDLLDDTRPHR